MILTTWGTLLVLSLTVASCTGYALKDEGVAKALGKPTGSYRKFYYIALQAFGILREFFFEVVLWAYIGVRLLLSSTYREVYTDKEVSQIKEDQDKH